MDKKKILIIVGVVAVVGIGLYMWNKSKKNAEGGASGDAQAPADASANKSAEAPADAPADAKKPLTTRKEKKKACGRKPLSKKKRAEWQKCVDAGGSAFEGDYDDFEGDDYDEFEGDFDAFEKDYMDFEGEVDNQFMYSEFENSLNLDL